MIDVFSTRCVADELNFSQRRSGRKCIRQRLHDLLQAFAVCRAARVNFFEKYLGIANFAIDLELGIDHRREPFRR